MKAKPLDLDFRQVRAASPWAGWLMLAIAAAFLADLGHAWQGARQTIARAEARLAQQAQAGALPRTAPSAPLPSREEMAVARETIDRLQLPWDPLFGALEGAATGEVALAAIEPDPANGKVVISGQARSFPAVLDYVGKLRGAPALARAHLVRHEARPDDPQRPVAFAVAAEWKETSR